MPSPDRNPSPSERMSILIAEDSAVIQTVLRSMLTHWGYDVALAADGLDALRILERPDAPRLAIVDWMMPGLQGPELCRQLRTAGTEPYTYVLLLTSRADAEDVVAGLDAGADDYLTKPFNAQELRARVRAGTRIVQLHRQLLAAREDLRQRATYDSLTGLYNRASILEIFDRHLASADRGGSPLSLLLIDVDRFRQINDSFGHLAGDAVLRECGRRIAVLAGESSSLGRYSGEEFLVLLPGVERAAAQALGDRIRENVAAEPFEAGAASFPVTVTIGVVGRDLPYSSDAAALLRSADEALMAAKAEARERLAGTLRASAAAIAPERIYAARKLRLSRPQSPTLR